MKKMKVGLSILLLSTCVATFFVATEQKEAEAATAPASTYKQNNRLMTSGYGHNLVIANNGFAYGFGYNRWMQTGHSNSSGATIMRNAAKIYTDLPNVVAVSSGYHTSYLLTADGSLYAFGNNDNYATLGLGAYGTTSTPRLVTTINNVINVAGGENHSLFLTADGSVYTVGKNANGQLGLGDTTERKSPTKIPGITNAVLVTAGLNSSYIVTADGSVYSFGSNENGALGRGDAPTSTSIPTKVSGLSDVVVIESMGTHTLAVTKNGNVYAFGSNQYGQLGLGDTTNRSTPVKIPNIESIIDVDASDRHSLLLSEEGRVYSFGSNQYGQLGLGDQSNRSTPTPIAEIRNAVAVTGGTNHSIIMTADGSFYAMGSNSEGSLGFGYELGYKLSPTKIPDFSMEQTIPNESFVHTYDQMDQIATMSMGGFMFLSRDKYVYFSGTGTSEISGFGDTTQWNTSTRLPRITNAVAVKRSSAHTLIVTEDNSLYSFGSNSKGGLGFGDMVERTIPTKVPFDFGEIRSISGGNGSSFVINENGEAYAFGSNAYAQLGLGDKENRTTPTKIPGLHDIVDIKTSDVFTLFLTADGSVHVSGRNEYGQLGLGDKVERLVPTKVLTIKNAVAIALGNHHALVLTADGSVYSWGRNQYGQLGFGDTTTRMTPVKIPNLPVVANIDASTYNSYLVAKDGSVYSFGDNSFGQLGLGDTTRRTTPTKIPGISNAVSVGADWTNAFVLLEDSTFFTFGDNGFGQLGLGNTTDRLTPVKVPNRNTARISFDYRSPSAFLSVDTKESGAKRVTVTVNGYDFGGSQFKRIKNPDGTYTKGSVSTFVVSENGTYTFEFEDYARNKSTKSITITNLDNTPPTFVSASIEGANYVTSNQHWVSPNKEFTLRLKGKDDASGITRMLQILERIDDTGTLIREYGDFDTRNNRTVETKLTNFTVIEHAITYNVGMEKETTLTLKVNAANKVLHYDYRYNMHDGAGHNLYTMNGHQNPDTAKKLSVDGEKPTGIVTPNTTDYTNSTLTLTAVASDGLGSGMKRIKLPNGTYVYGTNTTYSVSANGTYTFEFEDNVGNVFTKSIAVTNIDKTAPRIQFTPESREADFKDIEVQTNILDVDGSGYKQSRYVWTNDETYPTEGWSAWEASPNPMITQDKGGKWFLHLEATDHVGNSSYAKSGTYEKIVVSGGPSVNVTAFPVPTGQWSAKPIDVYVMDSGDSELLAKANKYYEITNSPLYPADFSEAIPVDKKIQLNLQGENFIHVQYVLDDGTKIASTSGPYLIDTSTVGDFDMKVTNTAGAQVTDWTNQNVRLVITDPASTSVSGTLKQYRIEGLHSDWQNYTGNTTLQVEGNRRIFGRMVNGTGVSSEQKIVVSAIDKTRPELSSLKLSKNVDGSYAVSAKATDSLSGIKEVRLNNGTVLTPTGTAYAINNVLVKPTHLTIIDYAGNQLSPVSFADEPVIRFDAPYTVDKEQHNQDVIVNLTQATGFLIDSKAYACSDDPCRVVITQNATLTAVHTQGNKETRSQIKLTNIDKTTYQLIMSGKRNPSDLLEVTFKWNLPLLNGTLGCLEEGSTVNYPVYGNSLQVKGKNYTYDCTVTGTYKGKSFTSNRIVIYADERLPYEGGTDVTHKHVSVPVYVTETRVGKSYIINGKSDNYKYYGVPVPQNEITSN